jgi:hypothetical protein
MAVKPGIGRCLETQAASTTVDGCDAVREFDTFDDARQLVRALELAPRLHPHEGRIDQYCSRLRQRTFGAHRAMPDGGENGLDRIGGAKNARGDRRDIFDGVIFLEGLDCRHGCHVAGNCKNASVHALCCSLFENLDSSTKRNAVEFVCKDFEWSLIAQAFAGSIIQPILDHRKLFV